MADKSLLVVEDEVLVARDIKSRLTRMGYNVVDTVTKGRIAIERALELRPDLVLMDIHLADDIDGIDAAMKIRETYNVPVIFCTAYSNKETLDRAKISEPYGYVLKPFDNRELEINIEIALYKHQVEKDLAETRRRLDATLSNISDGVIVTNLQGDVCLINPMAEKITGSCKEKALKIKLCQLLHLSEYETGGQQFKTHNIQADISVKNLRQQLHQYKGETIPIELSANVIKSDDDDLIVITLREISQQLAYEKRIRQSVFYDDLTGLPNRALFMNRLESSLNRRKRGGHGDFAVVFFDLDGFASINEGLGHEIGDQVLKEISSRIAQIVRPDDVISRFSGDIFAVLLDPIDGVEGAIQASERIQHAISLPIELPTTIFNISASAGIVLDQKMYSTGEDMARDADTALHRAKSDANGSYIVFNSGMYRTALQFIERKSSMQQAMLDGAFEVNYQPIVDVKTEKLISMEALVRWPHPLEGLVPPAEFIPIAEQTGLILPLGEFVLRSVCQQIRRWNDMGFNNFRVAVNLSARQFEHNLTDLIGGIIEETNISPDSLTLEITEGIAMKNVDQNILMLQQLRDLGLSISIDDFGTGYSSLAYLKRFPLNTLKIDRSFIQDITTSVDDREITKAIIAMGQNLNLKILAEGVETFDQVKILRDSGCDYIQGYYYSRPLSTDRMSKYMEERMN